MHYTNFSKKNSKLMNEKLSTFHGKILDVGGADFVKQIDTTLGDDYLCLDLKKTANTSILADAHDIPFKNESFNCVICNAVLEHVEQPSKVLAEIYRVLKFDGLLWVSVPFLQHIHADPYDFRRFTNNGLKYEVESVGFKVIEIYGSYGIIDTIEYLLFSGIVWKFKDKVFNNILSSVYLIALSLLFIFIKILGIIFSSIQYKDFNHAVAFMLIAKKTRGFSLCQK